MKPCASADPADSSPCRRSTSTVCWTLTPRFPCPALVPRKIRPRVIARLSRTPYLVTPPTQKLLAQVRRRHPFLHVAPYVPELEHHAARGGLRRVFARWYRAMGKTSLGRAILGRIGFFLCVHGRLPVEQLP